jgi:tRNA (mo5U34)-methyltransferase
MKPWRKGPFRLSQTYIDSEWQSFIKYNLLEPHFDLKDKVVGDVGCNNGYYLFRMLQDSPRKLVGFDPSALNYTQFHFIDHFIQSGIVYELLGVEHVEYTSTVSTYSFAWGCSTTEATRSHHSSLSTRDWRRVVS